MLSGGRTPRSTTNIVGSLSYTLAPVCRHPRGSRIPMAKLPCASAPNQFRKPTAHVALLYSRTNRVHGNMRDLRFVRAPQKDFGDALIPEQSGLQLSKVPHFWLSKIPSLCTFSTSNPVQIITDWFMFINISPKSGVRDWLLSRGSAQ